MPIIGKGAFLDWSLWAITFYLAMGVPLNVLSHSKPERYTMAPVVVVLVACFVVISLVQVENAVHLAQTGFMNLESSQGVIKYEDGSRPADYLYRVSLKAVIFDERGRILVVKETGRDWWDLPGGGMDHDETVKGALARELHEEVSLIGDFTYRAILAEDPRYLARHNLYQMRVTFLVKPEHMDFTAGEDGDEVAFIEPELFKDSSLMTERRIYEYSTLAHEALTD